MNSTHCPYCNASLPSLATLPSADKLPCPRCGELVGTAAWRIDPSRAPAKLSDPPLELPGKGKTVYVILGIMAVMALVGFSYALWTVTLRRSRDPWMPTTQRRPLELAGLGYLPKGCQFVAGLHIAEIMEDRKIARTLLDEPRPALVDWVLRQVNGTTGLSLEEIDHIVLAANPAAPFSQLVVIIETRKPYAKEKIAKVGWPARPALHEDKALYEAKLSPAGHALVWCVSERTVTCVFGLDAPKREHLAGLSVNPRPLKEALAAPVHQAIVQRLANHQLLWAVGEFDQLGAARDWLPFALGAKAEFGLLANLKIVTFGVEPGTDLTLTANFQTTDATSASRLKAALDQVKVAGAKSQKITATPTDAQEHWITWQVRGNASAVRELLNRGKTAEK